MDNVCCSLFELPFLRCGNYELNIALKVAFFPRYKLSPSNVVVGIWNFEGTQVLIFKNCIETGGLILKKGRPYLSIEIVTDEAYTK